jgi:hypothetical protein
MNFCTIQADQFDGATPKQEDVGRLRLSIVKTIAEPNRRIHVLISAGAVV